MGNHPDVSPVDVRSPGERSGMRDTKVLGNGRLARGTFGPEP